MSKKKITRNQNEKRKKLLEPILNKWVRFKMPGTDNDYIYMYHRTKDNEQSSSSKLEQFILSGDEIHDGKYSINDFDIRLKRDAKTKKETIELILKNFDQICGLFGRTKMNFDELKDFLVNEEKILTEEEVDLFLSSQLRPGDMEEMELSFDDEEKEGSL